MHATAGQGVFAIEDLFLILIFISTHPPTLNNTQNGLRDDGMGALCARSWPPPPARASSPSRSSHSYSNPRPNSNSNLSQVAATAGQGVFAIEELLESLLARVRAQEPLIASAPR